MASVPARISRGVSAVLCGTSVLLLLAGCAVKHPTGNLVRGKQLFVQKCSSCHTLARADARGQVGPNLDDAFRQDRVDGVKSTSIEGLVSYWIENPNTQGVMPAGLVKGQDAQDVAAYVARVAAVPGQDSGALANAVPNAAQKPAVEKNGALEIDADPNGQLKFLASSATAKPGQVTLRMKNMSTVDHDIAIKGGGLNDIGKIVANGGVSTITVNLKPGKYTFYCSVDDHAAAGMEGTLTVK